MIHTLVKAFFSPYLWVRDEFKVHNFFFVGAIHVGEEEGELLLDGSFKQKHLAIGGVFHQPLDEVGHLHNKRIIKMHHRKLKSHFDEIFDSYLVCFVNGVLGLLAVRTQGHLFH